MKSKGLGLLVLSARTLFWAFPRVIAATSGTMTNIFGPVWAVRQLIDGYRLTRYFVIAILFKQGIIERQKSSTTEEKKV